MSAERKLDVVLYWHMHQPEYQDRRTGSYHLPWTYLHVIKDYTDMAAHLEENPEARAVVNFTPTLLEQIDDYAAQINSHRDHGETIRDPMLDALVQPVLPTSNEQRHTLIKHCLRANEKRLIKRYKEYDRLVLIARYLEEHPDAIIYVHDQYLIDIITWFHLAWLGETVKRSDLRVRKLIEKGVGFSLHDRNELLGIIGELCTNVISRYRNLAERGQIELSMTPYAHPIMPLLLDIKSAHEAMPVAPLPKLDAYPGGTERVQWHIEKGMQVFERYFGFRPTGCWPSEGSVSEATIELLGKHGVKWLASGENVLRNSLNHHNEQELNGCLHSAYQFAQNAPACFFRDDGLSDLVGFTYATWHADDAVANLIHHIENIGKACQTETRPVVSIILDGENAWEYYPENGYHFLKALYQQLGTHPNIQLTTFSEYLAGKPVLKPLSKVVAGSWVYGTFSTWIGSADKNRGWEMLADVKRAVDRQLTSKAYSDEQREKIETQLAVCEGSDWFWWFGDYNPADTVSDFESLFRAQLASLYMLLGAEPPAYLTESFTHGAGHPSVGGTMRRGKES